MTLSIGERKKPVWGRTALISMLGAVLLSYVGVASNTLPGETWALVLLIGVTAGIVLAIVSLVKGEKRPLAVVTLSLALVLPLFLVVGFVVYFTFFYQA